MKIFLISILYIFISDVIFAQETDSLQNTIKPDSINTVLQIGDSLQSQSQVPSVINKNKIALDNFWKKMQNTNTLEADSGRQLLFNFQDILIYNYTGFADIFRHQSSYQIYDFIDMGLPRYVANLNLLPHQTSLFYDGHILNDPIHGMFNTRFVTLDGIQEVEKLEHGKQVYSDIIGFGTGINIKSPVVNFHEPYTRIMFRQGDFGYTDLDISFAQQFNKNVSVYLGGINKIYKGENNYGFQYRAGMNYRIKDNILSHTTFNMDREKLEVVNLSVYKNYRYREFRHDFNNDIYYITNPEKRERWHLRIGYLRARRKNDSVQDNFLVRRRVDQLNIGLDRNLHYKKFTAIGGISVFQNKIWGSSFKNKLTDSGLNGTIQLLYKLKDGFDIDGKLRASYLYGQATSADPSIYINYYSNYIVVSIGGQRAKRFPYRNERSLYFQQFRGNTNLDNESLNTVSFTANVNPFNNFKVSTDIGYKILENEIIFDGSTFKNGSDRKFSYLALKSNYKFYRFAIEASGQLNSAAINLSPKKSFSAQLHYRDKWLKGAIIIDVVGNFHWYDNHNSIFYNPIVERLYWTQELTEGYSIFSFKIAATVKSAQLFMAMDNPLSTDYQYISGYYEFYRRLRFGLNWVLWD